MILLETRGLQVHYPMTDVFISFPDLLLKKGECLSLVGPSGSGKTTLLNALFGLNFSGVVYGKVRFRGEDLAGMSPLSRYRQMAYMPQFAQNALNPALRVKACFRHIEKSLFAVGREIWQEWLKELKLAPDVLELFPHQLSGGMKQRLVLLLGALKRPLLYAVDEPSSGVDALTLKLVMDFLQRRKKEGMALLLVSHDLGLVKTLSDNIIRLG